MPLQHIQFTLIRPVFPPHNRACFDRVFQHIKPLLTIAFTTAKLPVEKILLPDWFPDRARPTACHVSTPEFHPSTEWRYRNMHRRSEKMEVVGHNDITPYQPVIRFAPCFKNKLMNFRVSEQRTAAIHVPADILNDCLILGFQRGQMRQSFSTKLLQWLVHNFQRDELCKFLTLIKRIRSWTCVTRPSDTSLRDRFDRSALF